MKRRKKWQAEIAICSASGRLFYFAQTLNNWSDIGRDGRVIHHGASQRGPWPLLKRVVAPGAGEEAGKYCAINVERLSGGQGSGDSSFGSEADIISHEHGPSRNQIPHEG